jgi:tetratricopeptide (TPR) repeat protein
MWRAAWHDYEVHPWLGSGAGTYERYWNRHRDIAYAVRDAHSLYLETLAELGPIGLALLVTALGTPLLAALKARHVEAVPAAFGGYVAYLLHAAGDWDWELAGVTVTALLLAGSLLVAARTKGALTTASPMRRLALLAITVPVTGLVIVALIGNRAADSSAAAARHARTAIRWMPWSADPWLLLGQAQLEQGELAAARRSFERAIAEDGGNWESWYGLALATGGVSRRQALDHALSLNPLEPVLVAARSFGLVRIDPLAVARERRRR